MGVFPPCYSSEMVEKFLGSVCGKMKDPPVTKQKIQGTVVLMKKNVLDATDLGSSFLDRVYEIFGKRVSLQLISADKFDPEKKERGKLGEPAFLEDWVSKLTSVSAKNNAQFSVTFDWDESFGVPGAFIVKNMHHSQFFLKTVTLDNVPGSGPIHFECHSWIYPANRYKYRRVFFSNKTYLPSDTPETLRLYREEELINLRGNGTGLLKEWDRVYDYACYNDLGSPEKGKGSERTILGGSMEFPYPRRGRTSRPPHKKDPKSESRLFLLSLNIYVPRDEQFGHVKFSDFIGYSVKSLGQVMLPEIKALFDKTINEFDTMEDVYNLYEGGIKLPAGHSLQQIRECVPWELFRELLRSDGERFMKLPVPDVIKDNKAGWRTDEEFGREMLAGVNPVCIRRLEEFPPSSKLDSELFGNQNSTITREHVEKNMNGLTVEEALENNKLYILDHHDALMPYLRRINTTSTKTYASRTVLLLQEDDTLKPIAIELSLPHEEGDNRGVVSQVFIPSSESGVQDSIWQLAKAYAAVNDSGYHQLISHWLNTHAVIEPFIIATNRQLSVLHPIYKLLKPHFRDTMHINALARQVLINADGVLERTVFPARYALELSTQVYKNWNFNDQALPVDLVKRGMAVNDPSEPSGVKLLIKDYPYAVDGLEIWSAIESWVREYCSFYYPTDDKVEEDSELRLWWTEIREKGHGDLKDEPWWPRLETQDDLIHHCTIIIWIASALHAAVNFGQYAYAGFLPNRPTLSRRFMPKPGTPEYTELESNPDSVFLKTITAQFQTLLGVTLIEILSRHSSDEVYLGQRETLQWTADNESLEAFDRFGAALEKIENGIMERNNDKRLKNRTGPIRTSYTLLYPNTSGDGNLSGLTGKGIPNSISI